MSAYNAPNYYFNGIIFNPKYYTSTTTSTGGITQSYADNQYLARLGTPNSIATNTSFSGNITAPTINTTSINGNITSTGTSTFNTINATTINGNVTGNSLTISGIASINSSGLTLTYNAPTYYGRISMGDIITLNSSGASVNTQYANFTAGQGIWYFNFPYANSSFQYNINGTTYMTISTSGVQSTAFNATSDYRIKENIQPIIETIDDLKPVKYYNKLTDKIDYGFIAHELNEIFPEMVNGNKDDLDVKGEPKYQSINYISIIALLVREVQILKSKINI